MPSDVHVQQQSSPLSLVRSNGAASLSEHHHHPHHYQQHHGTSNGLTNQSSDQSVYMQRYKALREAGFDETTANKYSSLYSSVNEVIDAILSQSLNDHLALENGNGSGNGSDKPPVHNGNAKASGKGKANHQNHNTNNIVLSNQQQQATSAGNNTSTAVTPTTPTSASFNGGSGAMSDNVSVESLQSIYSSPENNNLSSSASTSTSSTSGSSGSASFVLSPSSSSAQSSSSCETLASNNNHHNNNLNNHHNHNNNNNNKPNLNGNSSAVAAGQFNDISGNRFGNECEDNDSPVADGSSSCSHSSSVANNHSHHYHSNQTSNNNGFGNGHNGINHPSSHPNANNKHRNHNHNSNHHPNHNNQTPNGNQTLIPNVNCLTRATDFIENNNNNLSNDTFIGSKNNININGNSQPALQSSPEEANFSINELFNYKALFASKGDQHALHNGTQQHQQSYSDYSDSKQQQELLSQLILMKKLQSSQLHGDGSNNHNNSNNSFNNNLLVTVLKDGFFDSGDEVILEDEGVLADQNGSNSASSSVSMSSGTMSLLLDTSSSPSSFSSLSSSISTTPPNALNGYDANNLIEATANLNDSPFINFSFSSKNLNVAYGNSNQDNSKSPTKNKFVDGTKDPFSAFNLNGEELNKLSATGASNGNKAENSTESNSTMFDSFSHKSIYNNRNGNGGGCQFETPGIHDSNLKTAPVSKSISQQAADNGNFQQQYNDLELKYHNQNSDSATAAAGGFLFNLSPVQLQTTINCDTNELLFDNYNVANIGSAGNCPNGNNNGSGNRDFNLASNDNFSKYLSQTTPNNSNGARDSNLFNSNKNSNGNANHLFGIKSNNPYSNEDCRSNGGGGAGGLFAYPNESIEQSSTSSIFDYDRCNESNMFHAFNQDKFHHRSSFENCPKTNDSSSFADFGHFGLKESNNFSSNFNESQNDLFFNSANHQSADSNELMGGGNNPMSSSHYQNAFNSQRSFADIAASSLHNSKSNGENYFGAIGDCKSPKSNQMNCPNMGLNSMNSGNSNGYFSLFRNNNSMSSPGQFFYDQLNNGQQQQCMNGNKKQQSPYCGQQSQQQQNGYKSSMSPLSNKFAPNQMMNDQMNGYGPNLSMGSGLANQSNQLPTSQSAGDGSASLSLSDSTNRPTNLMGYKGLWVCNVSPDVTLAYLKRRFRRFGHFTGIQTFERRATNGSNIVFVHYDNLYSPVEAIACLHNYVGQDLCADQSEPLKLRFAPSMEQSRAGQLPTLEQARKIVERSGECFNWRLSSGCHRGVRCQLKHVQINKEIDSQPWVKALKKKNNET